jgi:hypothetical protein
MALQGRQKNGVPRLDEGRRLKELFECIPRTTGVFKTTKVNLTCLDAGEELLAIGSDSGTVFIYEKNRKRTGMLPSQVALRCLRKEVVARYHPFILGKKQ